MKIAYASTFNPKDIHQWSGTPYYMTTALEQESVHVDYLGPLTNYKTPITHKLAKSIKKFFGQPESQRFHPDILKNYSQQIFEQIKKSNDIDVILAPTINAIAYLDCPQPIILWTDALFAGLTAFYPPSSSLSDLSIQYGNQATAAALTRCKLAIFSSDWAARSAIELYGTHPDKVKVIPFGANLEINHTLADIKEIIKARSRTTIKLLFIGQQWAIKGGDIVFNVAKALNTAGHSVELNFVGCLPPAEIEIPSYIKCHGFISKHTIEGKTKLTQLLRESHFLLVPSRAEAFGIVFCEANAFGLPALATYAGGISTIIKNNINGMMFAHDAAVETYCDYITDLFKNYSHYETLATAAFQEYETRLNWKTATTNLQQLLKNL